MRGTRSTNGYRITPTFDSTPQKLCEQDRHSSCIGRQCGLSALPATNICHFDAFSQLLLQPWQLTELFDKLHCFLQNGRTYTHEGRKLNTLRVKQASWQSKGHG